MDHGSHETMKILCKRHEELLFWKILYHCLMMI